MNNQQLKARIFPKPLPVLVAVILAFLGLAQFVSAQQSAIDVVWVRGPIYMLAGAGGNIMASIGPDGVLLVDSGTIAMADAVLEAIAEIQVMQLEGRAYAWAGIENWGAEGRLSVLAYRDGYAPPKPVRYILNTSADPDHSGGNQIIKDSGITYVGGNVAGSILDAGVGASIYAREETLFRMACRGAVMAGDRLEMEDLQGLLRRGEGLPQDRTCAHGRPVRVLLTRADLEKAFYRR